MSEALADVREGFSKKEIKMAIGVASDPRYKQGNYSGAVRAIEKIKKGLSTHPQVAAVLKRQNEEIFEKVKCPHCEGDGCPKCEGNGYMADAVDKEDEPFLKDLIKNLRKGSATHSKQADDLEKAVKEETELDEGTWAVPETPAQKRDLKKLLSKPLPLGKEGENASDKMYSIIGDDELFDDLYSAGKESPDSDARPIIKKAMKRLKIREDSWDSWRLEESTKPDHIKVFNSLKKGDKVEINYDSAIAGGTTKTFVIKTKNKVYKGKVDKVTMYPDGKTGGVKFHLYQYDNRPGVYMAIGDMGASLRDIKKL